MRDSIKMIKLFNFQVNVLYLTLTVIVLSCVLNDYQVVSYKIVEIPKNDTIMEHLRNPTKIIRPSLSDYKNLRKRFITEESDRALGSDIYLNENELKANKIIMAAKNKEIQIGFNNPYNFTPSRHLFEVLTQINQSDLFKIIKKMPKGGMLHAHDTALCSTDYVVSITYRDHLWQCYNLTNVNHIQFLFSREQPTDIPDDFSEWTLVADERLKVGNEVYDKKIRKLFTLFTDDPINAFKDINDVWSRFMHIFMAVDPLITYVPVWQDYYRNALKELYADGVQYLEFRGTLPMVYDLDGNKYTETDIVQMYTDVRDEFMAENPGFIGSKFIYGPVRIVNDYKIAEYMDILGKIHKKFPDFVAGFDFVGQEDLGRPLIDLIEQLLSIPDNIKFFFHAGETNWFGTTSDDNLIDAVLLGTQRIGHGFGLLKHPKVLEIVKERNIAIEVNPISNQVLKLVDDYRNHPCSVLFADNYPVVISSDDPSFWEGSLSHDFFQAFLGMASKKQDLRLLKKLAINSINYSAMNEQEKIIAFQKWNQKWEEFILELIDTDYTTNLVN